MFRRLWTLAIAAMLLGISGGCGDADKADSMLISLPDLPPDGMIPRKFTCDGDDFSPALAWTDPPAGTQSFVVIVDDPDAPGRTFAHWAAFDIGASVRRLGEGAGNATAAGFSQANNDFGTVGYRGPCPPRGHGAHTYRFRLLALDVAKLPAGRSPTVAQVERNATRHELASAMVTARYRRD
ncbi:YbhB/YbcL family Raf kinase inhibitor-like protein [Croceicoccus ponticola]|nr:YbhB/YbcL family Raf kinase inhibitor-like protein [Croceicoccus ponticola]